jgi:hypothetical protein
MKVFSVYDSKAEGYMQPFFLKTVGEAERALANLVREPDHNFSRYAEDFTLFELGLWDEKKGAFDLHDAPRSVSNLISYRRDFQ